MSYPQPPTQPVRCYEDGSCDPPPPSPDMYITPANATPPGPAYPPMADSQEELLAGMQYGLTQRRPHLHGLFGGGG